MYSLNVLPTAQIDCDEKVLFQGGDQSRTRRIDCFSYLLTSENRVILIDTGIMDIEAVNRTKRGKDFWRREEPDADLPAQLLKHGYRPEQVTDIILTHAHYDHISGVPLLVNANVYISEREWDVLYSRDNPMKGELLQVQEFLEKRRRQGFVFLTHETDQVYEDVFLFRVGGHSAGSQMIRTLTQLGETVFTGDAVFLRENIEKNCPIGFSQFPEEAARAIWLCRKNPAVYMTGHDLLCLDQGRGGENK